MKAIRLGLLLGLIATMSAACAETGAAPPLSMTATTLTAGWEQHFVRVDGDRAEPELAQGRRLRLQPQREFATSLRVLAQAVDSGGAVVGQRIAYVPGGVGGFGRAHFEVPSLPATASYRLSVWDYTWFQADGTQM